MAFNLRVSAPLIAAAAGIAVGLVAAQSQATCSGTPIALTGTDGPLGPGQGPGVMFTVLGNAGPALNASGQAVFRSAMTSAGTPGGLWFYSGGANGIYAVSGGAQPGGGSYPVGAPTDASFNSPLLNNAGNRGWRNGNNSGLFADTGGGPGVIELNGGAAPGTGGANFSTFNTSPPQLMSGGGSMVFRAGLTANAASVPPTITTPATTANATGIWGGAPGSVSVLARQNDAIPSLTALDVRLGAPDTGSNAMVMNSGGTLMFVSALQGTVVTSGTTSNNAGLMIKPSGGPLSVVARRNDAFPGATAGENYNTVSLPAINDAGRIAYTSTLRGGAITGTVAGLFTGNPASPTLSLRSGTLMPNITAPTGGSFNGATWGGFFSNLSMNTAGDVAFGNTGITGGTVTSGAGIFKMSAAGVFSAVMQGGDVAPGAMSSLPGDTVKIGSLQGGISFNALGQLAFTTGLSGSIAGGIFGGPGGNNTALWATNLDGSLCLIAQKGMPFEVAPGDIRTVSDANLFQCSTSGNESGLKSIFNDNGDLIFSLDFSDGSSGAFLTHIPSPGAATLLGLGGIFASRRRRSANH